MITLTIAALIATIATGLAGYLSWRDGSRPHWYAWPVAWFMCFMVMLILLAGLQATPAYWANIWNMVQ